MRLTRKRYGSTFRRRSNSSIVGGRPDSASVLSRRANAANTANPENEFRMTAVFNERNMRPISAVKKKTTKVKDLEAEVENLKRQLLSAKIESKNEKRENYLIKFIGLLFQQTLNHNNSISAALSKIKISESDERLMNDVLDNNIMALKMLFKTIEESDFKQLQTMFDKTGFQYKELQTPELMRTQSPSPEGVEYKQDRLVDKSFIPGIQIASRDGTLIETIRKRDGKYSPLLAMPKAVPYFKHTEDTFTLPDDLKTTILKSKGSREKKAGGSRKKKSRGSRKKK
tara:strand:+ start:22071 stop:22925 length:855 start_codon:yes stop_codon:yes gene_type:complete